MKTYTILADSVSGINGLVFKKGDAVTSDRFIQDHIQDLMSQKAIEELQETPVVSEKKK